MRRDKNFHPSAILLIAFLIPAIASADSGKIQLNEKHNTDVVILENGDRNTGEIKKMEFGILYLRSDRAVDTLRLDWEKVIRVQSVARFEFESISKDVYIGTIAKQPKAEVPSGELEVLLDDGSTVRLKIREIISVHEMGRSILSRINLTLDVGASFTSANKRTQSNVNLSVSFRKRKYSTSLTLSSVFGAEPDTEETARHELQLTANRHLKDKWDAVALAAFLRDNQQDLDLRTTAGGGVLRYFVETNRTLFYSLGGMVYTKENYFNNQFDRNNAEALAMLGFSTYRFRGSSFNGVLSVFPSLSDPGRIRVDTSVNWKWEIVGDLYWKISFYDNYDNQPPPNGINNNLSISTTVGWSF